MIKVPQAPSSSPTTRPIRVLVVDDSSVTRMLLERSLGSDPGIEIVGSAGDAYAARDLIVQLEPDVMTLDITMPGMDGITFLRRVMKHRPMPIIIVSGLAREGADVVLAALSAGAVDVVQKPAGAVSVAEFASDLIARVKAVFNGGHIYDAAMRHANSATFGTDQSASNDLIFAMGASTGGVSALSDILVAFPGDAPPTLVAQHLPANFTNSFAQRLNSMCEIEVKEAVDHDRAERGLALIAPGGSHMTLQRDSIGYFVRVQEGPPIRHQRPSVDLLFESVAKAAGKHAVGVILTGVENDGAQGLLKMRQAGACTIAQDQASSVVFGMPQAAIKDNAAEQVVALSEMATAMFMACHACRS